MKKMYLFALVGLMGFPCMQARSYKGPFAHMHEMLDFFDHMFEEIEEQNVQAKKTISQQTPLSFSHSEESDALILTFKGLEEQNLKADLEGNTIHIAIPKNTIKIVVHPRSIQIITAYHAISETNNNTERDDSPTGYSRYESSYESSTQFATQGTLQLDALANNPKNIEFDAESKALTICIPKKNNRKPLSINVVSQKEEKEEKQDDDEVEQQKPKVIMVNEK